MCISLFYGPKDEMHRTKGVVTNYKEVGLQSGRGGGPSFTLQKKGADKVLAMLRGGEGQNMFWGSFSLEVLAIPFKRGGGGSQFFVFCLEGGRKQFWTRAFPIL